MYAVILAGGRGERLWPKSAKGKSKHVLSFGTRNVMIQETIRRLRCRLTPQNIFLVTTKKQYPSLKRYISGLDKKNIILEPQSKDTAAAICLAAFTLEHKWGHCVMTIIPSDHIIKNVDLFFKNLTAADKIASSNYSLVTIGISPKYPSVGYGYIEIQKKMDGCYTVKRFTEKPDRKTAERFYRHRNYLWNSGIYVWRTDSILEALKRCMPDLYYGLKDALSTGRGYSMKLENEYARLKPISIDYGVMEPVAKSKGQKLFCIKARFDWVDIGSWSSVEEIYDKDSKGNIMLSNCADIDVKDSIIIGERGHRIGVIGVRDLIIVQTKSGTLVCHKNRAQEVKGLVRRFNIKI